MSPWLISLACSHLTDPDDKPDGIRRLLHTKKMDQTFSCPHRMVLGPMWELVKLCFRSNQCLHLRAACGILPVWCLVFLLPPWSEQSHAEGHHPVLITPETAALCMTGFLLPGPAASTAPVESGTVALEAIS